MNLYRSAAVASKFSISYLIIQNELRVKKFLLVHCIEGEEKLNFQVGIILTFIIGKYCARVEMKNMGMKIAAIEKRKKFFR